MDVNKRKTILHRIERKLSVPNLSSKLTDELSSKIKGDELINATLQDE